MKVCHSLLLAAALLNGPSAALTFGPLVTDVSSRGARIVWVTDRETATIAVEVGAREQAATPTLSPIPLDPYGMERSRVRDERLATVVLDSLPAGGRVSYIIVSGRDTLHGSFVTLAAKPKAVSFAVYGDSRSGPGRHTSVAKAIAAHFPDFVVNTGDLVGNGNEFGLWQEEFFDPAAPLLRTAPMVAAKGNHEKKGRYFEMFFGPYGSFDHGNLHMITLNTCLDPPEHAAMVAWLERDLSASKARWKIVSLHHPIYNIGGHGTAWGRKDVLPILLRYGVDLVVAGHSHLYERFKPIGPRGAKPIIHMVTGGGGAPNVRAGESPFLVGGASISELHYCLFKVDGDLLECVVKGTDERVLDQFAVAKKGEGFARQVMEEALDAALVDMVTGYTDAFACTVSTVPARNASLEINVLALKVPGPVAIRAKPVAGHGAWDIPEQSFRVAPGDTAFAVRATPRQDLAVNWWGFDEQLVLGFSCEIAGRKLDLRSGVYTHPTLVTFPPPSPIPRLGAEPVIDGDLGEWAGVAPLPDIPTGKAGPLRVGWTPAGIHGALEYGDRRIAAGRSEYHKGDCLELFLENDNRKSLYLHEDAIHYVLFAPGPEADAGMLVSPYDRASSRYFGVRTSAVASKNGYRLEFTIPVEELAAAPLETDRAVGFNYCLSDDGVVVARFARDRNDHVSFKRPISWGTVVLSDSDPR